MARGPEVTHVRIWFLASIESAKLLCQEVEPLRRVNATLGGLPSEHVDRIIELSFMGVVADWESFLEQTFVRYMAGATDGFRTELRIGRCKDISHAYKVLSAKPDYDPQDHVLSFRSPQKVAALARLFFHEGAPYARPLATHGRLLSLAFDLRDRVAHSSEKSTRRLGNAAEHFSVQGAGALRSRGYRVGHILCLRANTRQGFDGSPSGTVCGAYMGLFSSLAMEIVPPAAP